MRRGLAGLLFFIAALCLALAGGGWWLQRIAFDTSSSGELADVVMRDEAIRTEVSTIIAEAAAPSLGVPSGELRPLVEQYVQSSDPEIRAALGDIVSQSHARVIGEREEPVQITGAQIVPIVRNQQAASLAPITLPVEEVGVLSGIRPTRQTERLGDPVVTRDGRLAQGTERSEQLGAWRDSRAGPGRGL